MSSSDDENSDIFLFIRFYTTKKFSIVNVKDVKSFNDNFEEKFFLVKADDGKFHRAQIFFKGNSKMEVEKMSESKRRLKFIQSKDDSVVMNDPKNIRDTVTKKKKAKEAAVLSAKRIADRDKLHKKLLSEKESFLGNKTPESSPEKSPLSSPEVILQSSPEKVSESSSEKRSPSSSEKINKNSSEEISDHSLNESPKIIRNKVAKKMLKVHELEDKLKEANNLIASLSAKRKLDMSDFSNTKKQQKNRIDRLPIPSTSRYPSDLSDVSDNLSDSEDDLEQIEGAVQKEYRRLKESGDRIGASNFDCSEKSKSAKRYKTFRCSKNVKRIHLGEGISLKESVFRDIYENNDCKKFAKDLAKAIWTREVLMNRYVKSHNPSALKQIPNRSPRKQLTPRKERVLRKCYRDFVNKNKMEDKEKKKIINKCGTFVGDEIKYLRTKLLQYKKKEVDTDNQ